MSYHRNLFSEYSKDIRKPWIIINYLIGRARLRCRILLLSMTSEYLMRGLLLTHGFAKYFSSIGQALAEEIPKSNHTSEYYMKSAPNKH